MDLLGNRQQRYQQLKEQLHVRQLRRPSMWQDHQPQETIRVLSVLQVIFGLVQVVEDWPVPMIVSRTLMHKQCPTDPTVSDTMSEGTK